MNWTSERKLAAGFAIIFVVLLINALISAICIRNIAVNGTWLLRSRDILNEVGELESSLREAGIGVYGYILTGKDDYLEIDQRGMSELADHIDRLRVLTHDNPEKLAQVEALDRAVQRWVE